MKTTTAPAIVMNMFYTGLGIARSLGERGIPVIGLTSQHGIYGNFTRYAKILFCPDSRHQPEALGAWLVQLGRRLETRGVIFPTRDDDVAFLDRFRRELEPYFALTVPGGDVLNACLSKWETFRCAERAGVGTPQCWLIASREDIARVAAEAIYPCVLKPVSSRDWRMGGNWELVGGRKAIGIRSPEELTTEYAAIARAGEQALVQEMVAGGDDCLWIAACYLDRNSKFVTGFNTQKLVQIPEGFGTGCIVRSADRPELFEPAVRVLQAMRFTGIAEVEFKWDAARGEYRLIEINPRPWDQHRLGATCGNDVIYAAYCEHAGLAMPPASRPAPPVKWIAEDAFLMAMLGLLWKRDAKWKSLLRLARGKRIYAIWSLRDPLPAVAYAVTRFFPGLLRTACAALRSRIGKRRGKRSSTNSVIYENFTKGKSPS